VSSAPEQQDQEEQQAARCSDSTCRTTATRIHMARMIRRDGSGSHLLSHWCRACAGGRRQQQQQVCNICASKPATL
jgi:ABC-type transporter Mla MlaB component